ncbi:energy transducer TonB [Pseudoxanthomonas sp. SGD-10]|nr:energy transducer TonB [Pseudoxanthomonas sp. SGD-10]
MFYANGKLKEEGEFQKPTGSVGTTRFDEPNYIVKQIADSLGNNFLDSAGSGKVNITYANGDIVEGEYIKGLKHGERKEYYSKSNETYIEEYEQGKFLKGNYINSAGGKTEYKGKEQFPEFKGGMKEFYKFISRNLRYPKLMKENNIQGRVTVGFVVEKDGTLSDIKVIKGVPNGSQLDDEAIRVISLSPKWNPGIQRGKPVRVSYSFPLVFSLTNEPAKKL